MLCVGSPNRWLLDELDLFDVLARGLAIQRELAADNLDDLGVAALGELLGGLAGGLAGLVGVLPKLAGQRGVLALLSDSTNAERPGFTATEQKVAAGVRSLFARARNKRIIIATFASNIYRVQQIIDLAVEDGRKVAFSGRSMVNNTAMAQELGYRTVFWSLAYVDWNNDSQPTREQAFAKLLPRTHPGAVVLLHSTSRTNAEILDELLTKWEEEGYRFATVEELFAS